MPSAPPRPLRSAAIPLFLLALCAYAYFFQAGGWNQNSRLDMVRALVERGTLRIDAYHHNTGDKAVVGSRTYCDKAPGLQLWVVPAAAAARPLLPAGDAGAPALAYVAQLAGASLPGALAVVLLFGIARRLGASARGAALAALAFGLGSPYWAYATLLWGHALATACLVAGLAAVVALRDAPPRWLPALGAAVGLAGGWATVTELPAAVPAAILALAAVSQARARGATRPVALSLLAAAAGCAAVLMLHNALAFGSPLRIGYAGVQGFERMEEGLFGVTVPRLAVLGQVLFGAYRGLLPLAPALGLGALGLLLWTRLQHARLPANTAAAIAGYFVLLTAAYAYWHGGWSYGPRHLAGSLPLLALGLAPLWDTSGRAARAAIAAAVVWGAALALIAVSTTAQPPQQIPRPLGDLLWPAFVSGDLALNHQSVLSADADWQRLRDPALPRHAWNWGQRLGLRGLASLGPLALALGALGGWLWRATRPGSDA